MSVLCAGESCARMVCALSACHRAEGNNRSAHLQEAQMQDCLTEVTASVQHGVAPAERLPVAIGTPVVRFKGCESDSQGLSPHSIRLDLAGAVRLEGAKLLWYSDERHRLRQEGVQLPVQSLARLA
eukprot:5247170-Prymnesium_polylepis.1